MLPLASRASRSCTIVRLGDLEIGSGRLIVMAGPCSIENREMLLDTARRLAAMGVPILRGGAFKPRTSPYAFQGLGEDGLKLLSEARAETGLRVVTEVMSPDKVGLVAEHADILQIGARNMQNFDLLRECAKVRKPVLLKRGLSATIDEWLAAAEYVLAGNPDVILCERGIRTFETATRNTLDLAALPVLRERTHLPVIVDPSHATGRRDYVGPMARASVAAGADGLLIEVHPDPDHAWCDGPQSLTPPMLESLLRDLQVIAPVVDRSLPACACGERSAAAAARVEPVDGVAFQGEPGAYSEKACRALSSSPTLPCREFSDVFDAVESGAARLGVVPIENTLGGSILPVYDLLMERRLHVVGETALRIVHCLIGAGDEASVRRVYAHPQAAAQCDAFLRDHPAWTVIHAYDTAGSVKLIQGPEDAAIASREAAGLHGHRVLREGIESHPRNFTRFLAIAREPADGDRSMLAFETRHEPGALARVLDRLAQNALNLTKLESRPIPGRPWEYRFYADVDGRADEDALRDVTASVRVLGRFAPGARP
jgi:3-deoxy-7-phosphoheptulonate synthase